MRSTAWTSDRIAPKSQAAPTAKSKSKQQQKGGGDAPAKSMEVRKLEKLRNDLQKASGRDKDPTGGCFCLGRSAHFCRHCLFS